jgi:uncharacterized membrane protein/plastocyanin
MIAFLSDWLALLLRWFHVTAAIAWIGHAFLFHSIHEHLGTPKEPVDPKRQVEGDLWMIHGGHFYYLQKTHTLPPGVSKDLLWFKWEAGFTWLSGVLLLLFVFYAGGGMYLVDPSIAAIPAWQAMIIGLSAIAGGFAAYDTLWASPIGRNKPVAAAISVLGLIGITTLLTSTLSGRAAFIHVGGLLGTCMALNVWMRIMPGQRRMLAGLDAGKPLDEDLAARTAARSTHNGYMQFPVIFVMISNHYPALYGHPHNAVALLLMFVVGAGTRQILYDGRKTHPVVLAAIATAALVLAGLTVPRPAVDEPVAVAPPSTGIAPTAIFDVAGQVLLEGPPPTPKELTLTGCATGTAIDDAVKVGDGGGLANVLVWVSGGLDPKYAVPPAPTAEVTLDQHGCVYVPRVVGVQVGQPVVFVNSDPVLHNVRTVTTENTAFNELMPEQNQRITRTFRRPEVAIEARCDVHPWMTSHIGVFANPYFAVTDERGEFVIHGLPPGDYTVATWHEVYGNREEHVGITPASAGGPATAIIKYQAVNP